MSDTKDTGNSGGRKPLTVSRGGGTVKQTFSHGRSKQVVVETKKRRSVGAQGKPGVGKPGAKGGASGGKPVSKLAAAAKKLGITEEELVARQKVLLQRRAAEAKRKVEIETQQARTKALQDHQHAKVQEVKEREEAEARRKSDEEDRKKAEAEAKVKAAEDAKAPRTSDRDDAARPSGGTAGGSGKPAPSQADIEAAASSAGGRRKGGDRGREDRDRGREQAGGRGRGGDKRRKGKLTIASALGDDGDRQRSLASVRRARERERERRTGGDSQEKVSVEVKLPETITLQDLSGRMKERVGDVVKFMMQQGEMMRGNDIIDADTAELIAQEFGHTVKRVSEADVEIGLEGVDDDPKDLVSRSPIVTIMGHVDHGKTSLLDAMRSTDVVSGEAGGITQHIGAYQVQLKSGEKISFLDTPGHAAFSAMRARGADVTDIAIIVVAANDSVMPQTIEAIKHAKAAEVPIIIAVNKVDLQDSNPQKVLTDLLQHDVQVEAMGGDVQAIEVSALNKTGLDELTEAITLQAELLDLKANPNRDADGIVVESKLDKGRGPVATVLVKRGTLKRGDIVVAGAQWGKVRALVNERNQQMKEALPSMPAEILGMDGTPQPGDVFNVVENEARAREITEYRDRAQRQTRGVATQRASLEQFMTTLSAEGAVKTKDLPIVLKGDVQGSVEAITQAIEQFATDEVRANVVYGAAGGISESDVLLAQASGAPVFAFNVRANKQARELAEKEGVEIRYYSIIYHLLDEVKDTLSGMLAPERKENFIGYADILEVFNITKTGKVAGCKITEGVVKRGCGVRLLRDDVVIHEGKLKTLKRFKDEVTEVTNGMECGMAFEKYEDIREGDRIECFEIEMIARKLD
jgi:translation initiation factor IF-2